MNKMSIPCTFETIPACYIASIVRQTVRFMCKSSTRPIAQSEQICVKDIYMQLCTALALHYKDRTSTTFTQKETEQHISKQQPLIEIHRH